MLLYQKDTLIMYNNSQVEEFYTGSQNRYVVSNLVTNTSYTFAIKMTGPSIPSPLFSANATISTASMLLYYSKFLFASLFPLALSICFYHTLSVSKLLSTPLFSTHSTVSNAKVTSLGREREEGRITKGEDGIHNHTLRG